MKKFLFVLVSLAFIFSSCEDESVREGRKLYKMYFDKVLKDPKSFIVYDEKYTVNDEYTVNWVLDAGAKNSLGGMVRKTYDITTVGETIEVDGELYRKADLK
ncbi:hypothetical protein ACIXT9_02130 [Bacteroides fragilis]